MTPLSGAAASHGALAGQSQPCRCWCHFVILAIPSRRWSLGPARVLDANGNDAVALAFFAAQIPPSSEGTYVGHSVLHREFACATGLVCRRPACCALPPGPQGMVWAPVQQRGGHRILYAIRHPDLLQARPRVGLCVKSAVFSM